MDLIEDGFESKNPTKEISDILNRLFGKYDLDDISESEKLLSDFSNGVDNSDVFRTKLGDIKQIQNLQKINNELIESLNKELSKSIGVNKYQVLNNQLFSKPPNYKMTSAHQDNAYFNANLETKVYTFWIPLMNVNLLNGCMFYVPRSHASGLVEHKPIGTNLRTRTGVKGFSLYSDYYKNSDFVQVDMDKHQVLVHDKNTMHFSSPNLTDNYRISFTCIMKVIE